MQSTAKLLEYYSYWLTDGLDERDFEEIEFSYWIDLNENQLVGSFFENIEFKRKFWKFIKYLSQISITNTFRNIAYLCVRVRCLIYWTSYEHEPMSEIDEQFWQLIPVCERHDYIRLNADKSMLRIGSDIILNFPISIIPTKYKMFIQDYFSIEKKIIVFPTTPYSKDDKIIPLQKKLSEPEPQNLLERLNACPTGRQHCNEFEDIGVEIFTYLFSPPLEEPDTQSRTADGVERRDALFPIGLPKPVSFWFKMLMKYNSQFIVVEFKNYTSDAQSSFIDQVDRYLNRAIGHFGIVWTRNNIPDNILNNQLRKLTEDNKIIIVVNDDDVKKMIELKMQNTSPEFILQNKINTLLKSR